MMTDSIGMSPISFTETHSVCRRQWHSPDWWNSPELEGDPVELLQRTVRTSSKYIDSRTVNSGYLDTRQYGKVLDLITTDSLQLYNTETSTEVVTTDIDFSHKRTGNEKINVSLTFRQASRLHLAFERTGDNGIYGRIFDRTFDNTFE